MIDSPQNPKLVEKTIDKIAQVIFSAQIDRAETLEIHVSADTDRITSGTVDGLELNADGVVVSSNVSMASFAIRLQTFSINPLKAVVGNVELQEPTQGSIQMVLNNRNIAYVLRSKKVLDFLHEKETIVKGIDAKSVSIDAVDCQLAEGGALSVQMTYGIENRDEPIQIDLQTQLEFIPDEGAITFRDTQIKTDGDLSQKLAEFTVAQTWKFINLKYMEIEGVSLEIDRVKFQASKLSISAQVYVIKIPD
ncbi:LmeA family phospholipid-binding protein [Baaleninema sp.]|uniref:LmeA family phospholipid-binding protein n=1 Tax=Baaleninema sp. TaxID=3101197 RepID=UPI003D07172A